jgi:hypothetical protein
MRDGSIFTRVNSLWKISYFKQKGSGICMDCGWMYGCMAVCMDLKILDPIFADFCSSQNFPDLKVRLDQSESDTALHRPRIGHHPLYISNFLNFILNF